MNTTVRKEFCRVYVALPQNWQNRSNVVKRALGAIQRAHPHLAIVGVNEPGTAHAHYFVDTTGKQWTVRKAFNTNTLETIALNQGEVQKELQDLDFTKASPTPDASIVATGKDAK